MYYFIIEAAENSYLPECLAAFLGALFAYLFNIWLQEIIDKKKKDEREKEQKNFETLKFNYVISISHANFEELKVFLEILINRMQKLEKKEDEIFSNIPFSFTKLEIKELQFTANDSRVIETFAYMDNALNDLEYILNSYNSNIINKQLLGGKLSIGSHINNVKPLMNKTYILIDSVNQLIQTIYQYNENNNKLNLLKYELTEDDKILYKKAEQQRLNIEISNIEQVNNNE